MLFLRITAVLSGIVLAVVLLLYMLTKDRRYLRAARHVLLATLFCVVAALLVLFLERLWMLV